MSRIQAVNAALLRERRYENALGETYDPTAAESRPNERDRWAVYTLLKAGQIERQHRDAAEWLWALIEDAHNPAPGWIDPMNQGFYTRSVESAHVRMMKRCTSARAAENALHALSLQGYGRIARALFDSYAGRGRPTVAMIADHTDMETNGCRRRIRETLEALSDYRDRVDADRAAHKARVTGIDTTHFSEQKFATI